MKLKPSSNQKGAGAIPVGWDAPRVASVCRLINGRGFKPSEWRRAGLPIIRIQNLNGSNDFNHFDGAYHPKLEVVAGQLLFAWSGSRGTSFGPHIWRGPMGLLNYHTWKVDVPEGGVAKSFLFHALRGLTTYIEGKAHGAAALVHVQKGEMEGFRVPVPNSTVEQGAIATALSDADALIESLEQLLAKKRYLKQGAMQELLTGKKRLPGFAAHWKSEFVKRIVQVPVTDGPHLTPSFVDDGVPFLSVNNLVDGRIDFSDLRYISAVDHETFSRKCRPRRGDILLGKAASVGKVAIVEVDFELNIWSPIALIRVSDRHVPRFVYYQLQSRTLEKQIQLLTNSSSQGNIGMADIERLVLPLPPRDEQDAIALVLTEMDSEIAAVEAKRTKARHIKQGMMQELLTGRIRLV